MLILKRAALCLVIIHGSSGCAAMTMRSPKSTDPAVSPRCSESRGGVVLDGLFTALYGTVGAGLLGFDEGVASLPFLALGAAHLASGIAGYRSSSRCTKAHEAHEEWLAGIQLRARRMPDTTDDSTGKYGGRCYGNLTCDEGLECEQNARACIPASAAPPGVEAGPAAGTAAAGTPVDRPADKPVDRPADKPVDRPARTHEPAAKPRPPMDGIYESDFWREVNL